MRFLVAIVLSSLGPDTGWRSEADGSLTADGWADTEAPVRDDLMSREGADDRGAPVMNSTLNSVIVGA